MEIIIGDVISIPFKTEYLEHIAEKCAETRAFFRKEQSKSTVELNPAYFECYEYIVYNHFHSVYRLDLTSPYDMSLDWSSISIQFKVISIDKNRIYYTPVNENLSTYMEKYITSYPLFLEDLNKKFYLMGGVRVVDDEIKIIGIDIEAHNAKIDRKIAELEAQKL